MTEHTGAIERIIAIAEENIERGIFEEPRFYYDEIVINDSTSIRTFSNQGAFVNGEQYPIRLTHLEAAIRLLASDGAAVVTDERIIQRVGLRMNFHGHDYMRREFEPLPIWHNQRTAAAHVVSFGQSTHVFARPAVLSARDTMVVTVRLERATSSSNTRIITVSFTGYGLVTKRPYFFSGQSIALSTTVAVNIDPSRYTNDGDEPIVLTDMTVHCAAENLANNPQGDIRECRVQIRMVNGGTGADWFIGPSASATTGAINDRMPAVLLGTHSGRCIVHEFPKPVIWEPGEGLTLEVQALIGSLQATGDAVLALSLSGTLVAP